MRGGDQGRVQVVDDLKGLGLASNGAGRHGGGDGELKT
jgi:hypothetical protein